MTGEHVLSEPSGSIQGIDRVEAQVSMMIDCDSCAVRGLACHDCVVTVLLGPPPETGFDDEERRALDVLAESGLVPRLRMVSPVDSPTAPPDAATG